MPKLLSLLLSLLLLGSAPLLAEPPAQTDKPVVDDEAMTITAERPRGDDC